MEISELQECIKRLERLEQNDDYRKTIEEVDAHFFLKQNVFAVLKAAQNHEFVLAKEGARAYSMKLKGLLEETKQAFKDAQQENNDE
jgi:hypothetical protein